MIARARTLGLMTAFAFLLSSPAVVWAAEQHMDHDQMDQTMDRQDMDHQGVESQQIGDTGRSDRWRQPGPNMLLASDPIDGASLDQAPDAFSLAFVHPVQLSLVRLTTIAGEVIPVPLDPKAESAAGVSVPLPPLSAGHYRIEWRAVGDDGHIMSGGLSFSVN